jgi:hypothetical protein
MAKRMIALLAVALALATVLPPPQSNAQYDGQSFHRTFPGIGIILPRWRRHLLQRKVPQRVPYYYYDNRGTFFGPRRATGSGELAASLRARGFRDIGPIQQRGTTFICEATGPSGERVRLVINGLTGGIDGVRVIGFSNKRN